MARVFNFNAGPSTLPLAVLQQIKDELLEHGASGMSIMEMSHRGHSYAAIQQAAVNNIRQLMDIPKEYEILLLHGGASQQFAIIPMNLRRSKKSADYIDTGVWSGKALREASITGQVRTIWSGCEENYTHIPKNEELSFSQDAEYVYICSNETIGGLRWKNFPQTQAPLVADMSSEIMSRTIDIRQFGLAYACTQKNLGPSGLTVIIIRQDLLNRAPQDIPSYFQYTTHVKENNLFNTPNTWAVYVLKLMTEWIQSMGGVAVVQKINESKAATLYSILDSSDFWHPNVEKDSRSIMNITWHLSDKQLEDLFVKEAEAAGMIDLKNHRLGSGIRASIYNAVTPEAVNTLAAFMKDFERRYG